MEPDSHSRRQARPSEQDDKLALYRQLEGFDGNEPLLSRDPARLGFRRSAYWQLLPGLYLRRLPLSQILGLAVAIVVLLALWPVTVALLLGLLRVILGLRVLLLPLGAILLAVWLLHSLRPNS